MNLAQQGGSHSVIIPWEAKEISQKADSIESHSAISPCRLMGGAYAVKAGMVVPNPLMSSQGRRVSPTQILEGHDRHVAPRYSYSFEFAATRRKAEKRQAQHSCEVSEPRTDVTDMVARVMTGDCAEAWKERLHHSLELEHNVGRGLDRVGYTVVHRRNR